MLVKENPYSKVLTLYLLNNMGEFITFLGNNLADFWTYTGFANATEGHVVMILVGLFFIYLAVAKEFEQIGRAHV